MRWRLRQALKIWYSKDRMGGVMADVYCIPIRKGEGRTL